MVLTHPQMRRIPQGLGVPPQKLPIVCAQAPLNPRTLFSLLIGVLGSTLYAMGDANSEPLSVMVSVVVDGLFFCFHVFFSPSHFYNHHLEPESIFDPEGPRKQNQFWLCFATAHLWFKAACFFILFRVW